MLPDVVEFRKRKAEELIQIKQPVGYTEENDDRHFNGTLFPFLDKSGAYKFPV